MAGDVDVKGLWETFQAYLNRLMAWLVAVLGKRTWDPGYFDK